ncbi:XAC2610-related protein [Luteimonas sp. A649]
MSLRREDGIPPSCGIQVRSTFESGSRKFRECVATAGDDSQARGLCLDEELAYRQRSMGALYQEWAAKLDSTQRGVLHAEHRTWQQETDRLCGPAAGAPPVGQVCRLERIMARYDVLNRRLSNATAGHWAEDMPDANGTLEMRLGDAVITMQSDGCSDRLPSKLICSNARLSVSTPTLHRQTLLLPEVWLPRALPTDRYPAETGFRGPSHAGFAESWHGIMLSDVNADEHEDLMVWSGPDGSYGDPSYTYYLYDPKTQRLVENTALAELMEGHSLSRIVDGRLFAWYRSGPCDRGERTIEVRYGAPRIVESTNYSTCGKDGPELDDAREQSESQREAR